MLRGNPSVEVMLAEVTGIDTTAHAVALGNGERVAYDILVLATGATHGYFGHDEWEQFAPGLKKIDDATEIRRRILTAFEQAESEVDAEKRAISRGGSDIRFWCGLVMCWVGARW